MTEDRGLYFWLHLYTFRYQSRWEKRSPELTPPKNSSHRPTHSDFVDRLRPSHNNFYESTQITNICQFTHLQKNSAHLILLTLNVVRQKAIEEGISCIPTTTTKTMCVSHMAEREPRRLPRNHFLRPSQIHRLREQEFLSLSRCRQNFRRLKWADKSYAPNWRDVYGEGNLQLGSELWFFS